MNLEQHAERLRPRFAAAGISLRVEDGYIVTEVRSCDCCLTRTSSRWHVHPTEGIDLCDDCLGMLR